MYYQTIKNTVLFLLFSLYACMVTALGTQLDDRKIGDEETPIGQESLSDSDEKIWILEKQTKNGVSQILFPDFLQKKVQNSIDYLKKSKDNEKFAELSYTKDRELITFLFLGKSSSGDTCFSMETSNEFIPSNRVVKRSLNKMRERVYKQNDENQPIPSRIQLDDFLDPSCHIYLGCIYDDFFVKAAISELKLPNLPVGPVNSDSFANINVFAFSLCFDKKLAPRGYKVHGIKFNNCNLSSYKTLGGLFENIDRVLKKNFNIEMQGVVSCIDAQEEGSMDNKKLCTNPTKVFVTGNPNEQLIENNFCRIRWKECLETRKVFSPSDFAAKNVYLFLFGAFF